MRVLMTADAVGGVWTYALDLVRALPDVEFTVATMGRRPSADQKADLPGNLTLVESDYRLEWEDDPWDDVRAAGEWLLDLARETRPDLVHLNGLVYAALPFEAPTLAVVHSDVLSWWQAVKGEPAPPSWDRYRREVERGLRAADAVAAPSHAMLDEAVRLYGPFKRTAVLPNGRAGVEPKAKEPFVFAAGRMWDEAKNVAALQALDLPWPALVAGDGSPMGRLPAEETLDHMARAAIYALPARYEPFGLSVLEAARAACALVLGDIPSLRENWEGRALFVDPNDPAALQGAITSLIDDSERRQHLGALARERALELSPERFAQGYRDLYESLPKVRKGRGWYAKRVTLP